MAKDDYAILVGISRYADSSLHKLDGPVLDVGLIQYWLELPEGGGLTSGNIVRIVSDELSQTPAPGENMPPLFQDFLDAYLKIVRKPDKKGFIQRADSRLYLYFSGHGFCNKYEREAHAALYLANADRDVSWNIYGTYFAQFAKDHGLFGEIVLIMDCCRDAELAKEPLVPPLRKPTDIGVTNQARLFELYAAPRGGKAQERKIPSRNNEVHGLLTHAFLDALHHAQPKNATVSSQDIKEYLREQWDALCGDEPADRPEAIVPTNGEIIFQRNGARDVLQRFKLKRLQEGSVFEVIDADFTVVALVTIGAGQATIERTGQAVHSYPITEGVIEVPLPATFCLAVAQTAEGVLKAKFQAGGNDVEL